MYFVSHFLMIYFVVSCSLSGITQQFCNNPKHSSTTSTVTCTGLSVFHKVQVTTDTSSKLPSTLLLSVNHRGVHLLSARSHKHLGSLQFRDVGECGGSGDTLTLSARVGGEMQRFAFATPSAVEITEAIDICIAGTGRVLRGQCISGLCGLCAILVSTSTSINIHNVLTTTSLPTHYHVDCSHYDVDCSHYDVDCSHCHVDCSHYHVDCSHYDVDCSHVCTLFPDAVQRAAKGTVSDAAVVSPRSEDGDDAQLARVRTLASRLGAKQGRVGSRRVSFSRQSRLAQTHVAVVLCVLCACLCVYVRVPVAYVA